jgi:hypothetical protein
MICIETICGECWWRMYSTLLLYVYVGQSS